MITSKSGGIVIKKHYQPIYGQTWHEKFLDFLTTRFSTVIGFAVHTGLMFTMIPALHVAQNILDSMFLVNLVIGCWLTLEVLDILALFLDAIATSHFLKLEPQIISKVSAYVSTHNNCSYNELVVHCMPLKVHLGLDAALDHLISSQKIVQDTNNGEICYRLPTEQELLIWYIESGESLSFSELEELFQDIIPEYDDYLDIEFFIHEETRCRIGKSISPDVFWFCADDSSRLEFSSFEDLCSACLFNNQNLRAFWDDVLVTEINGEYAQEWLHVYDSIKEYNQ